MDFSIKVENLTKQFGDLVAVDKVNLAIKPGQICGFLGPNGAGKSTTLRMLCGLITPTAGQGQILGLDIVTEAEEIKANSIAQLTGAVRWTQSVERMIADGADYFKELGPGNVLQGLVKKINAEVTAE